MKKKLNEKLFTYRIAVDRFMFKDGVLLYRSSGKQAGSLSANGYRIVSVRLGGVDRAYLVHRVIWLITYGRWPKHEIDHINRNKLDNRIDNLREADHAKNSLNIGIKGNNKSGYKGVSQIGNSGKWRAYCVVSGKGNFLGVYDTPEKAGAVYASFAKIAHGEFYQPPI